MEDEDEVRMERPEEEEEEETGDEDVPLWHYFMGYFPKDHRLQITVFKRFIEMETFT